MGLEKKLKGHSRLNGYWESESFGVAYGSVKLRIKACVCCVKMVRMVETLAIREA